MGDTEPIRGGPWVWVARGLTLSGAGLMSFGAWQAWPPGGFMVGGLLLFVIGLGALRM